MKFYFIRMPSVRLLTAFVLAAASLLTTRAYALCFWTPDMNRGAYDQCPAPIVVPQNAAVGTILATLTQTVSPTSGPIMRCDLAGGS